MSIGHHFGARNTEQLDALFPLNAPASLAFTGFTPHITGQIKTRCFGYPQTLGVPDQMAKILTQLTLDSLRPSDKRREIPDGKCAGLQHIIQPSGSRSWALRYKVGGKSAKLTLGPYPLIGLADARDRATIAKGQIIKGEDPAAEKRAVKAKAIEDQQPVDLIETIARIYVARYAKPQLRPHSVRLIEGMLAGNILPKWGKRRLSSITKRDVAAFLDDLADRAPVAANRTLSLLKSMSGWAVGRGLVEANPFVGIEKPRPETPRDRVLDSAEIAALMTALDGESYPVKQLVTVLLLTGARRSEAAEAKWSEFDLEARVWRLPAVRAKNGREHTLPLPDKVVDLLRGLPRFEGAEYVFSFHGGKRPVTNFNWKARLDEAVARALGKEVPAFTLHDLRRTCASGMAEIGVAPHIVEACLNHKSGTIRGVASVYNRYSYRAEMLAALTAWSRRVDEIRTGEVSSNVVALRR
jgi:integrase